MHKNQRLWTNAKLIYWRMNQWKTQRKKISTKKLFWKTLAKMNWIHIISFKLILAVSTGSFTLMSEKRCMLILTFSKKALRWWYIIWNRTNQKKPKKSKMKIRNHQSKKNEINAFFFQNVHRSEIPLLIDRIGNGGFDLNSSPHRSYDQIVEIFNSDIYWSRGESDDCSRN